MSTPRVSVVVPCHDDGAWLEEAICSALDQTLSDLEIIVADDGSTDAATRQWLDHESRPRVRVLRLPAGGVARARNAAIAVARGEYLLPLDADDRIAPSYAEKAAAVLDSEADVGLVECEAELFGDASGPWPRPRFAMPAYLLGNTLAPCALFRVADFRLTRGYDSRLVHGWEDYDLWLSLLERGRGVVRLSGTLFFYRQRPGSRSRRMTRAHWRASYLRLLVNHWRLYARHPTILPRYLLRMLTGSAWP
jgi:glycosyltransferase involved in cell wall biosynthesis